MTIPKNILERFEEYCKKNSISGKEKEQKLEKLKTAMQKYMYEPGEAIGIVAAQSISEPATQMCTDYSEKVVLKFRNRIKVVKIGELVDKAVAERYDNVNGYEIFDVPEGIEILTPSLNDDGEAEWKRITALCRCKSPESLLEAITLSGRSVKATDSHSFVIKQGDRIISVSGKELKIGDKVPVIEYLPEICIETLITQRYPAGELVLKRKNGTDVTWDEIIEIRRVKPSGEYVYDMTVEGNHTFAVFNGLIVHNTMRSYTLASQSDRLSKVTQGLPRLIEIFDARKTFEKNMIIYLKPDYNAKEKARDVANKIRGMRIADIIKSDSMDLVEMKIELELDGNADKEEMKKIIMKYIKGSEASIRGDRVYVRPAKEEVKNLRKIRQKLLKLHVKGVKGVDNVVVIKEGSDWVIQTAGTNLKKVLKVPEVDISRTKTNDVHEVYDVMGVEAARSIILQEAKETLDEQGLEVDVRHLMLLADMMTFSGSVKAIGRYGVSGKKSSVLAKANFEETKKHLINASFYGDEDTLDGVIENVLIGQITPIGTGMVELAIDMNKMREALKKKG